VFSVKARDEWVGWTVEKRRERLKHVMDAFILGAVPPYSYLLGGKLVAMLAASNEVRQAFREKYRGQAVDDQRLPPRRAAGHDHHHLRLGPLFHL
jgi:hypothetical protein